MIAGLLDYWNQYAMVLAAMVFLFGFKWIAPRFGLTASLLFICCACSSIWTWVYVPNRYVFVDPYNQMAIRYFACDSLAKIMLIAVPLMVLAESRFTFRLMGEVLGSIFVIANSLFSLFEARNGCNGLTCGGLIGNPSISMGFMACVLPLFIRSFRQWPIWLLAGAAIFVSKSSVALGLYAVFTSYLVWREFRRYAALPALASFIGLIALGRLALGNELLHDSDRFKIWRFMFDRWREPANIPTGTGIGTYHVLSINLQHMSGYSISSGYWWNTMHNDFFQMLFECGVIGLLLMVATYLAALLRVWREGDWPILMSAVLYGAYMFLDPALHNPLPALFGAWLFVYALRREPNLKEYV